MINTVGRSTSTKQLVNRSLAPQGEQKTAPRAPRLRRSGTVDAMPPSLTQATASFRPQLSRGRMFAWRPQLHQINTQEDYCNMTSAWSPAVCQLLVIGFCQSQLGRSLDGPPPAGRRRKTRRRDRRRPPPTPTQPAGLPPARPTARPPARASVEKKRNNILCDRVSSVVRDRIQCSTSPDSRHGVYALRQPVPAKSCGRCAAAFERGALRLSAHPG